MSGGRQTCRADRLAVGMAITAGGSFKPIAEIRTTAMRIGVRLDGESLWFTYQPDEQVYLEAPDHVYMLQAERRR